jgi:DNA-nicking Smr family endonuclease
MIRRLDPEERRLWSRVARTVRPAPGKRAEAVEEDAPAPGGKTAAKAPKPKSSSKPAPRRPGPPEDLSGQRRIRRGQAEIDARLDLHGHTQDTAHRELAEFIVRQHGKGARCLLVITGKGRQGPGVLRARLAHWIADPDLRPMIAGFAAAHARHGGEGAVYIFLKSPVRAKRR